jgi:octaprenyl-diphosphate synthase
MNSDGTEKKQVLNWLENKDFTPENIQAITEFTYKNGGVDYAISQMQTFKNKAIEELKGFVDSDVKQSLILCAEYAANREF